MTWVAPMAAVISLLGGCGEGRPGPAPKRGAVIVVSGDTAAWIAPCGCASNQSGGLSRRGTYLGALARDADVLYLDCGGAPGGTSDYHRIKFEAILDGEGMMGAAAHNLGGPELAFGSDAIRAIARGSPVPFVSANALDIDGAPLALPCRVIERGGRRLAVTGVVSTSFANTSVRVSEPRRAVLDAVAGIHGGFDVLIVLAYLPQAELEGLAAALPEADAVVGGPTGQAIAPRGAGAAVLASATNKGKYLVELRLGEGGRPDLAGSRVVELDAGFADDPDQVANLDRYLARLGERDLLASSSGLVPPLPSAVPATWRIAGTASCAGCHESDHDVWAESKHARAWQTLVDRGYHVDSYCQQCHVVGFGLPGGFASARQSAKPILDVGCESCHGPSGAHAIDPARPTAWDAFDQCLHCHDHENSPSFDLDKYWSRIAHGPGPRAGGSVP